jgi:hypothetical protein
MAICRSLAAARAAFEAAVAEKPAGRFMSAAVREWYKAAPDLARRDLGVAAVALRSRERHLRRIIHRDRTPVGAFGDRGSTIVVTSPVWTS